MNYEFCEFFEDIWIIDDTGVVIFFSFIVKTCEEGGKMKDDIENFTEFTGKQLL